MEQEGTVKEFSDAKGLGWIKPDNDDTLVFVYHTAIIAEGFRTLREWDRVRFTVSMGPKGPQAHDVRVIK